MLLTDHATEKSHHTVLPVIAPRCRRSVLFSLAVRYLLLILAAGILLSQLLNSHAYGLLLAAVVITLSALLWALVLLLTCAAGGLSGYLLRLVGWSEVLLFACWILFEADRPWWAEAAIALPLLVLLLQRPRRL